MKSAIKKIIYCIKKLLDFVFFLILILVNGKHKNVLRLSKCKKNKIAIIATGPSLKEDVHIILDEDYKKQTDLPFGLLILYFLNCVHDTIALLILCIFIVHGEMKRSFVFLIY